MSLPVTLGVGAALVVGRGRGRNGDVLEPDLVRRAVVDLDVRRVRTFGRRGEHGIEREIDIVTCRTRSPLDEPVEQQRRSGFGILRHGNGRARAAGPDLHALRRRAPAYCSR